ncbi:hypothetical protein ES703_06879 [subsurface metagenome]
MKCKICCKRKGTLLQLDKDLGEITICKECKIEFYEQSPEEDEKEERRAEFNAELGAGVYNLP